MANLNNVNLMNATQFNSLSEVSDDELYYVNIATDTDFQSLIAAGGVPDYNSGSTISNSTEYTFPTNGYLYLRLYKAGTGATSGSFTIDGVKFNVSGNDYNEDAFFVPIKAYSTFKLSISFITIAIFFPCSGEVSNV